MWTPKTVHNFPTIKQSFHFIMIALENPQRCTYTRYPVHCQWQWLTDDDFIRSTMHVVIVATPEYNCVFIWIYSITVDRRTADMRDNYFKNGRMKSERNQTEIPLKERRKGPLCIHTKLFSNCTTKAIFFPRVFTHFTFWRLVALWWWWWRCTVGISSVNIFHFFSNLHILRQLG